MGTYAASSLSSSSSLIPECSNVAGEFTYRRPTHKQKNTHTSLTVANFAKQVCVRRPTSVVNVTLPAFAAQRRRLLHGAPAARRYRSISLARRALSSKPTARHCCCRWTGQTDGRTDAGPFHRLCCAYYLGSVNKHQSCYSLETQTDTHIRSFDLPAPQK